MTHFQLYQLYDSSIFLDKGYLTVGLLRYITKGQPCWNCRRTSPLFWWNKVNSENNVVDPATIEYNREIHIGVPSIYLRNRSAPVVNCCLIIHCSEVSCKEDQITSAQRE